MLSKLIIYFIAGLTSATLQAINIRFISKEKALISAAITFVSAVVQFSVLIDIISNVKQSGFIAIIFYCLGASVGMYVGIKLRISRKAKEIILNK